MKASLESLLTEVRACTICRAALPHGVRPIVQADTAAVPRIVALPHPSPRNRIWVNKNPWFEEELLPKLRRRVRRLLKSPR